VKKWSVLILSVFVLCAAAWPVSAAEAPAPLGMLEIRGLDNLAGAAFELSKAAGQPMPKEMMSMMLYGALGTMPGMGIQPEGTLRVLWFAQEGGPGVAALLLPVENNGETLLSNLDQAGWKNESETADGLVRYIAPDGAGLAWNEVYFLKRGSTLVAGAAAADVRQAVAAMPTLPAILPVEGNVALQIHPAALAEAFRPQIEEQMDQAFQDPNLPAEAAAMGNLYLGAYLSAAKQLDACTLGLGVANGHLNFHSRVAPVAGSTLAAWLATVRAPSAASAVAALPGALFAETLNLGDLNVLGPAYFQFMDEMMKAMPAEPLGAEFMKTYMDNAKACWAQMNGDFGFALMPPTPENPLRLVEYIGLKDATILRNLTKQMVQSANEMLAAMSAKADQPMPFKLSLVSGEPREYREIPVDKLTYTLDMGGEVAAAWPKGIPTKFEIELAWVPGGVLASVGDSALTDTLVDRALDGGATPLSDLPAWKAAYPAPDKNLVDVTHFALFDILRSYVGLFDSQTGGSNAEMVPAGSGNLESTSYLVAGGLMSRLRFSLADIGAIGAKVKEAQEKAMAEMMKNMEMQESFDSGPSEGMEDEDWEMEDDESADEDLDGEEEAPASGEDAPESAPAPAMAE